MLNRFLLDNKLDSENKKVNLKKSDDSKKGSTTILEDIILIDTHEFVIFPGIVSSITIKNKFLIKFLKDSKEEINNVGIILRKNINKKSKEDFYKIGTLVKVLKLLSLPDDSAVLILFGKEKFKIKTINEKDDLLKASVEIIEEKKGKIKNELAIIDSLRDVTTKLLKYKQEPIFELQVVLTEIKSIDFLVYFLGSNISIDIEKKQNLLEILNLKSRAKKLLKYLMEALNFAKVKHDIQSKVNADFNQIQKEQLLKYHIKAIQEELGETDQSIANKLEEKRKKKNWTKDADEVFERTLNKIKRVSPSAPEYTINIEYAETLLSLPWNELSKDNLDIKNSEKILNEDHFGLEKIKERILEHLAVLKLKSDIKGPIICLHGPPGVGKTSLGRSIANALGRSFAKISLGGLGDEAEIRGHRKTYIGAMPGKIISTLRKVSYSNPLVLLDEVDKLSNIKGDPSAALLEVLDPEQNNKFVDHYLDIPYDLSKIMFLATANNLNTISKPLMDRMEIIEISGYTLEEKMEISKKYLIPKQKLEHGLKPKDFSLPDLTIEKIIDNYTMEAGVRNLERNIASICRKIAKYITTNCGYKKKITEENLYDFLGLKKVEKELYSEISTPGVAIALAWTSVGGDILFVETKFYKGNGKLKLSGQLGDVMKESVETAYSYIKSHAKKLEIDEDLFLKNDVHVHFPAGATPKDGPSAGITVTSALASLFSQRKIKSKLGMTGEMTLRGKVLPVGGIKEKILAAKRVGITHIILSKSNEKDILDIKKEYLEGLKFFYVKNIGEVLEMSLENKSAEE